MGKTYGACDTGRPQNDTQDAVCNAAIMAFCFVFYALIDSSDFTSLCFDQMVYLLTLFYDGLAVPHHDSILCYSTWAVQTHFGELGDDS